MSNSCVLPHIQCQGVICSIVDGVNKTTKIFHHISATENGEFLAKPLYIMYQTELHERLYIVALVCELTVYRMRG